MVPLVPGWADRPCRGPAVTAHSAFCVGSEGSVLTPPHRETDLRPQGEDHRPKQSREGGAVSPLSVCGLTDRGVPGAGAGLSRFSGPREPWSRGHAPYSQVTVQL